MSILYILFIYLFNAACTAKPSLLPNKFARSTEGTPARPIGVSQQPICCIDHPTFHEESPKLQALDQSWTFKMAKIMDPILPIYILSTLGYWANNIGALLEVQDVCTHLWVSGYLHGIQYNTYQHFA